MSTHLPILVSHNRPFISQSAIYTLRIAEFFDIDHGGLLLRVSKFEATVCVKAR